ncbi:hypothetical protein ES703_30056 [subsurface metagenome]
MTGVSNGPASLGRTIAVRFPITEVISRNAIRPDIRRMGTYI